MEKPPEDLRDLSLNGKADDQPQPRSVQDTIAKAMNRQYEAELQNWQKYMSSISSKLEQHPHESNSSDDGDSFDLVIDESADESLTNEPPESIRLPQHQDPHPAGRTMPPLEPIHYPKPRTEGVPLAAPSQLPSNIWESSAALPDNSHVGDDNQHRSSYPRSVPSGDSTEPVGISVDPVEDNLDDHDDNEKLKRIAKRGRPYSRQLAAMFYNSNPEVVSLYYKDPKKADQLWKQWVKEHTGELEKLASRSGRSTPSVHSENPQANVPFALSSTNLNRQPAQILTESHGMTAPPVTAPDPINQMRSARKSDSVPRSRLKRRPSERQEPEDSESDLSRSPPEASLLTGQHESKRHHDEASFSARPTPDQHRLDQLMAVSWQSRHICNQFIGLQETAIQEYFKMRSLTGRLQNLQISPGAEGTVGGGRSQFVGISDLFQAKFNQALQERMRMIMSPSRHVLNSVSSTTQTDQKFMQATIFRYQHARELDLSKSHLRLVIKFRKKNQNSSN